ncbi:orotidine 5'-phosphate decarboxylase / HUMPS family protein [Dactylosporangium sp. NPDC049525]|uniref:orotidine 5'-phosphate decarboxylase / HUMPS family protein n=1 Tax=Dactylosporangium sp. NPDC049525 TaxID=3154730 RepID=UPI00342BD88F
MPRSFWEHEAMREAFASRSIGKVIRAYRTHPHRGQHAIPQPVVAELLQLSQPHLSRIETRGTIDALQTLVFYAHTLRIPQQYLWFDYPADERYVLDTDLAVQGNEHGAGIQLGEQSNRRTRSLLNAVQAGSPVPLEYRPPDHAIDQLSTFVASPARVCLIEGPPGSGKSALTFNAATLLEDAADFQLHSLDSWAERQIDLASEILRYASLGSGADPLLALETACTNLTKLCVVVIDGIKGHDDLALVGRQVDGILRQVTDAHLRFLLVVRTPPNVDLTAFPVLAACVYQPTPQASGGGGIRLQQWSTAEARRAWDHSWQPGDARFADLPAALQQLSRLPLYMRLLKSVGRDLLTDHADQYRLVDFCVRATLRTVAADETLVLDALSGQALVELADVVPAQFGRAAALEDLHTLRTLGARSLLPLAHDGTAFGHDVIREYAAARDVAQQIVDRGRTASTIAGLNELADRARTSAAARGTFEFVISALDGDAPELLTSIALAPTINATSALPLMLSRASRAASFATAEVLRSSARRCRQDAGFELAQVLLAIPGLQAALGAEYATWVLDLLGRFGPTIWPDLVRMVDRIVDVAGVQSLVEAVDLERPEHAVFVARHAFLFQPDEQRAQDLYEGLVGHADWRVRAALAQGLTDGRNPRPVGAAAVISQLVRDEDYKVRAAAASAVARAAGRINQDHLDVLLADANWHVRACALGGLLDDASTAPAEKASAAAVIAISAESSWQRCPAHVDRLRQRLLLLHGEPPPAAAGHRQDEALFTLLREERTDWRPLPTELRAGLIARADESASWLLRREGAALRAGDVASARSTTLQAPSSGVAFRRLRGRRLIQVALDLRDLDEAVAVAQVAHEAGVDLVEVGDPLIKEFGLSAVSHIKRTVPDAIIVVEMMSADWGREQVILAAEAGADVVLLIGPATVASVSAAVAAGRRMGVPVLLDVPTHQVSQAWTRDMERAGVDGFVVTTNIDLGVRGRRPLDLSRQIRLWSRLPVAVSGGFSASDHGILAAPDWDILIVGRSVTEAVDPATTTRQLVDLIRRRSTKESDADPTA